MDDDYPHYHNQQPQQRRKQSFRHPSTVRIPLANNNKPLMKYKRNTTHIHISYRIHAHRQSLQPLQQHPMVNLLRSFIIVYKYLYCIFIIV
jgi:hypothetical protein